MDELKQKRFAAVREDLAQKVKAHGFAVIAVGPDEDAPPFAYTVGLSAKTKEARELLMVGLPPDIAHGALNTIAKRILESGAPRIGEDLAEVLNVPLRLHAVSGDRAADYMRLAEWYASTVSRVATPVRAWQVLWPDSFGMFPTDTGFTATDGEPLL